MVAATYAVLENMRVGSDLGHTVAKITVPYESCGDVQCTLSDQRYRELHAYKDSRRLE